MWKKETKMLKIMLFLHTFFDISRFGSTLRKIRRITCASRHTVEKHWFRLTKRENFFQVNFDDFWSQWRRHKFGLGAVVRHFRYYFISYWATPLAAVWKNLKIQRSKFISVNKMSFVIKKFQNSQSEPLSLDVSSIPRFT